MTRTLTAWVRYDKNFRVQYYIDTGEELASDVSYALTLEHPWQRELLVQYFNFVPGQVRFDLTLTIGTPETNPRVFPEKVIDVDVEPTMFTSIPDTDELWCHVEQTLLKCGEFFSALQEKRRACAAVGVQNG